MRDQKQNPKNQKQAVNFLKTIAKQIPLLKDKRNSIEQVIKQFSKQLYENHISVIISVHNSGDLLPLVEAAQIRLKEQKSKEVDAFLSLLYRIAYDCFFSRHQSYNKLFQSLKGKYEQKNKKIEYSELTGDQKLRHQTLSPCLKQYFQINNSKQELIPKLKRLQLLISQKVIQLLAQNAYEECFIGWLRTQLFLLQNSIFQQLRIQTDCMCCRLLFFSSEPLDSQEFVNIKFVSGQEKHKFMKEHQFFKKIAISFLNTLGGTIYLGIEFAKKVNVSGVPLSQAEKQKLTLFLFEELTLNILPYETEFNIKQDVKEQMRIYKENRLQRFKKQLTKSRNQYVFNEFITLEFINVYERDTLLFSRGEHEKYVVKINIRPGNQYNLYHLINQQKETPETYLWENKKEKKLTFSEFYEETYRRLKAKANKKKYQKGESPVHQFCRSFRPVLPTQLQNLSVNPRIQ